MLWNHTKCLALTCVLVLFAAAGCGKHEDPVGAAKLDVKHRKFTEAIKRLTAAPPDVLNTYAAQIVLAEAYKGADQFDKSVASYKRAAALDKTRSAPYVGLAEVEETRAWKSSNKTEAARFQMRALGHCQAALTIDEKNADIYATVARLHEARGELEKALAARKDAVKHDPSNPSRKIDLCRALLRLRKVPEATKTIDEAIQQDPSLAQARIMRAMILRVGGRPEALNEARKELTLALAEQKAPANVRGQALHDLAYICLQLNDLDETEKHAVELQKYKDFGPSAMFLLGSIYRQKGQWDKAYEALKSLEHVKRTDVLMQLAIVEEQRGMYNQAIAHYQKIVAEVDPMYLPARIQLVRLLSARRLYKEAMNHCDIVLRERPDHQQALRLKASIHRTAPDKLGDMEQARVCYLRMLVHDPDSVDARLLLADLALETGQPEAALAYAQAANSKKETAWGHLILGRAYMIEHYQSRAGASGADRANIEKAVEHLMKARGLAATTAEPILWLARAYVADKKPGAAIALLEEFVSKNPREGAAYVALASHYERDAKDLRKAIEVLEKASKIHAIAGFDPGALGRAYFLAGRYKDAITTWEQLTIGQDAQLVTPALRVGLAAALAADGQYAKALTHAETVIHQTGESATAGPLLAASIAIQAGQYSRARQFLQGREYPSPKTKESYLKFVELCEEAGPKGKKAAELISEGMLHSQFQSPAAAVERLGAATELVPDAVVPHYLVISSLVQARRFTDTANAFKRVFEKFPADGYAHLQFASMKRIMPRLVKEREELELALDLDPGLALAHVSLADVLLREVAASGDVSLLKEAVKHSTQAVELQGGGTQASLEMAARAHYAMAKLRRDELVKEENPDEINARRALAAESSSAASKVLQTLQEKFPRSVEAAKTRIRFELSERHHARAAALADSFIKNQQSQDPELHLLYALALAEQGEFTRAVDVLMDLIKANPTNLAAYRQLAGVYSQLDRADRVMQTLERLRRIDPANPQIAFDIASAYLKFGRPASAKIVYEELLGRLKSSAGSPMEQAIRNTAALGIARSLLEMPAATPAEKTENLHKALDALAPLINRPGGRKPSIPALLLRGNVEEELGDPSKAIVTYERCTELEPKDDQPYRAIALLHYRQGRYEKVVDIYTAKISPLLRYRPFMYSRMALAYLSRNAPDDASRAATMTAKARDLLSRRADPGSPLPEETARFYYDAAVLVHVANRKSYEARAEIKKNPQMTAAIQESCGQLVDVCAQDAASRRRFVSLHAAYLFYYSLGARKDAIATLEKTAATFPGNLYLLTRLAHLYQISNAMAKFAAVTEKLIDAAEKPDSTMPRADLEELYAELADTYLIRLAREMDDALARAEATCERGLKKWPKNLELLRRLASVKMAQKRTLEAEQVLNRSIAAAKEGSAPWVLAHQSLAILYAHSNRAQKAVAVCDTIEEHTQNDAAWLNNSAWFHATAPNPDLDKAIGLALQAKKLDPKSAEIRDTLGWILYLAGRYGNALPELVYAAQQLPKNANISYHLGAAYIKQNQLKEGLDALLKAVELSRQGSPLSEEKECRKLIEETKARLKPAS
ncbi:MAG: tetratricopeptide repeat protein [Planctomycetota bacterium]